MFSKAISLGTLTVLLLSASCTSLNSVQDRELKSWQSKRLEVKEKDPTVAAVLNILPGIGDFYNGNVGYGIGNLLMWPFSVLWAPVGGVSGAKEVNYYATKAYVEELETKRKKLKNEVESAFFGKQISQEQFYLANKKIESMETIEFEKNVSLQDLIPMYQQQFTNERIPTSTR